jgi:hypothetical protein
MAMNQISFMLSPDESQSPKIQCAPFTTALGEQVQNISKMA